eukprot:m.338854 g.338854  ORF g.338854 m.338854 type:complete len:491 (+) comp18566_c0_seq1:304-1776(+)
MDSNGSGADEVSQDEKLESVSSKKQTEEKPYDSGQGSSSKGSEGGDTAAALPDDGTPEIKFKKKKKKKMGLKMTPNLFENKYKLTGVVLGKGAYSVVEECECIEPGHCVNGMEKVKGDKFAVKVIEKKLDANFLDRESSREQVYREVELMMSCQNHPHILQLLDSFETDLDHKLVFEKVDGGELLSHIQDRKVFTELEASEVTKDMASALSFLHAKGIAHRDLKPQNVLCVRKDCASPSKLCDFNLGIAAAKNGTKTPPLSHPVGTPEFMSPEVVATINGLGQHTYDKRCDIWSLGVILFIMLSGNPPFAGDCGYDCGWKRGEFCEYCQEDLEEAISEFDFDISGPSWKNVSGAAKDLVCRMLVPESDRLTADQILQHPWIKQEAPDTPLETPGVLRNVSNVVLLENFASDANQMNRAVDSDMQLSHDSFPHPSPLVQCMDADGITIGRRPSLDNQKMLATSFRTISKMDVKSVNTPQLRRDRSRKGSAF